MYDCIVKMMDEGIREKCEMGGNYEKYCTNKVNVIRFSRFSQLFSTVRLSQLDGKGEKCEYEHLLAAIPKAGSDPTSYNIT